MSRPMGRRVMKTPEPASVEFLAGLLRQCLDEGRTVHIDRLGVFSPTAMARFDFTPARKPRVFIAYAAEDGKLVDRLCDRLEAGGIDAWLDRRKLMPGENWPRTIELAIQKADFFIACLTRRSVAKRGTFQAELRHALDCASKVPLDDIFFLPARLGTAACHIASPANCNTLTSSRIFEAGAKETRRDDRSGVDAADGTGIASATLGIDLLADRLGVLGGRVKLKVLLPGLDRGLVVLQLLPRNSQFAPTFGQRGIPLDGLQVSRRSGLVTALLRVEIAGFEFLLRLKRVEGVLFFNRDARVLFLEFGG